MSSLAPDRGDVFFANLEETIKSGRVLLGSRPAIIVASRVVRGTTIIIPTTTSGLRYRRFQPSCIMVDAGVGGLIEESAIVVHALREIDVENLPDFLGVMPDDVMAKIDVVLKEVLRLK